MNKNKILIIEDEEKIAESVSAYLKSKGYDIFLSDDGKKGLELFEKSQPDLVILDLMLPSLSGEEICIAIRKKSTVPIIMMTAKVREENKIDGFNLGADDYITKPFSLKELAVRVSSLLRRTKDSIVPLYKSMVWGEGDLELDFEAQTAKKLGKEIILTKSEFDLLSILSKYPNKAFTREELISYALGEDFDGFDRTVDSHIKNLRAKIETDTANPKYIITVRSVGYKFGGGSI
ncbi:MAG: response regulator transcription factor [Anaerovoracaceae bacterium]